MVCSLALAIASATGAVRSNPGNGVSTGLPKAVTKRQKVAPEAPATDGYKFTQAFRHTIGVAVERDERVFAHGAAGSPAMAEMDFPAVIVPVGSKWAIGQVKHGDETDLSLYTMPLATLGNSTAVQLATSNVL